MDENINLIDNESEFETSIITNSFSEWKNIVNEALFKISQGLMSKVVLSREVFVELNKKPVLTSLLTQLSEQYPKCYTFAYRKRKICFYWCFPGKTWQKYLMAGLKLMHLPVQHQEENLKMDDIEMENLFAP